MDQPFQYLFSHKKRNLFTEKRDYVKRGIRSPYFVFKLIKHTQRCM